jgi:hypothetical protein
MPGEPRRRAASVVRVCGAVVKTERALSRDAQGRAKLDAPRPGPRGPEAV